MIATGIAVACFAVCGYLLPRGVGAAERCVRRATRRVEVARPVDERRERALRRGAVVLGGVTVALVVGGVTGLFAGLGVAFAVARMFRRLGSADERRRRARLVADLPIAVDLLAACLRGGTSWEEAVRAVATALPGPLGDELDGVAARIRLGADPVDAWGALAADPVLAPLARTVARAAGSGATLAPSLTRLARDRRAEAHVEAVKRARAAGVHVLAPLGACFLPAFVLLGIVPSIAGLASSLGVPW
ncbi:Bacterial type II secretion system protein F domain protein [Actinomadura rubteroloni]|uniref:Bacterial type II secretion system protein F domain protein n=1 Tax=Actinomadura rubteroloni TaxID=1926885 RepID=A0A2P4UN57_9ACTN|nr:Bacterial type II secretion system protein F domain protein [Actinomadura rubteroloni]